MSVDTNSVVIIGRLTRDMELKYLNSGTAVGRFSIAVNRLGGQGKDNDVSFFDVVLWGKQAESLNPYLKKGTRVAVSGELRQSRWEQDGQSRSKVEINAQRVQLLGGDRQETTGGNPYRQLEPALERTVAPQTYSGPVQGPESFDDDSIPF